MTLLLLVVLAGFNGGIALGYFISRKTKKTAQETMKLSILVGLSVAMLSGAGTTMAMASGQPEIDPVMNLHESQEMTPEQKAKIELNKAEQRLSSQIHYDLTCIAIKNGANQEQAGFEREESYEFWKNSECGEHVKTAKEDFEKHVEAYREAYANYEQYRNEAKAAKAEEGQ